MADYEPLYPSRHNQQRHIYTVDLTAALETFRQYNTPYMLYPDNELTVHYIHSLVENLVNHLENQHQGVQSFVLHYAQLITEGISPGYLYHPLRLLKRMDNAGYERYVQCLYGLAESLYREFQACGLYSPSGLLLASYERLEYDTLYLQVRPELPDVSQFT